MSKELEKNYNPSEIEERLYQKWLDKKYFHAEVNRDKKPFTIVMPPPNITGKLHMGHALDNTMQDILIRFKRMQGYEALWVPGTDHASIATEAKVVEKLAKDEYYKSTGLLLPALRIIDEVKEDFQLDYLKRTVGICKEPIILLPSLKLYTQTETREECDLLQKRLASLKKEDIIASLGLSLIHI